MSGNGLAMMPWFPRDFIAATRAMRLAERGAYRELLDYQWEMGKLPSDHDRLARLLGITLDEFAELWPAIKDKFAEDAGFLVNKRLEEHRVKALTQRDKKRAAAAQTNAKRYAQRDGQRHAKRAQDDSLSDTHSASPPSPSPSSKKELASQAMGDDFAERFAEFKSLYPKRSGDQRWPSAEKHIRARLREGFTWSEILDGVRRYAGWVRAAGKEGTEVVKQAATFVGTDKGFTEDFEIPVGRPNGTHQQKPNRFEESTERLRQWVEGGTG